MPRQCGNCNATMLDEAKFCFTCGQPIPEPQPPQRRKEGFAVINAACPKCNSDDTQLVSLAIAGRTYVPPVPPKPFRRWVIHVFAIVCCLFVINTAGLPYLVQQEEGYRYIVNFMFVLTLFLLYVFFRMLYLNRKRTKVRDQFLKEKGKYWVCKRCGHEWVPQDV